jgi:hypothetical protein
MTECRIISFEKYEKCRIEKDNAGVDFFLKNGKRALDRSRTSGSLIDGSKGFP